MKLLTDSAKVFVNGSFVTYKLYKAGSAERHAASDDVTLKTELIRALNATVRESQGNGVFRVKINGGLGYVVYKVGVDGPNSAAIFHYHWNYKLDMPLTVF